MATRFEPLAKTEPLAIWPGVVARALQGERVTVAVVDLDPNIVVAEHQHENEQVGLVLKGNVTMVIDGEARQLGAGEAYVIPSNVLHSASTLEDGATVIDVFAPVRSDWAAAPRLTPSAGRWP